MKIIKKIIKTLFMFIIFFGTVNIYGYNLYYKADRPKNAIPGATGDACIITTPVQPFSETVDEYYSRASEQDEYGWIKPKGNDFNRSGTKVTFSTSYYTFTSLDDVVTEYKPGFDERSSNGTNNNIYYDRYLNLAKANKFIDESFDNVNLFTGAEANVPENQGTDTSGMYRIPKKLNTAEGNITVKLLDWKVVESANGGHVVIDRYILTHEAVEFLRQKFTEEELNKGIRFSNVLSTQFDRFPSSLEHHRNYMDTAWLYYNLTVGYWYSGGRGFVESDKWLPNATGTYKAGASVANEYDNVIQIPMPIKDIKRNVYINHINSETNAVLSGFENSSLVVTNLKTGATSTRNNLRDISGFQEHYIIEGLESLAVKKSPITKVGETTYTFTHAEASFANIFSNAKDGVNASSLSWSESPHPVKTNQDALVNDYMVINMYYDPYTPPPPDVLPTLQLTGRLEFINTSSEYINSTSGHDTDYIPSTKQLTPFAQDAYPYVVRALRYEPNNETKSSSTTVTTNINYKWDIWTYSHDNSPASRKLTCTTAEHSHSSGCYDDKGANTCGKTAHTHTGIYGSCYSHQHTSACDWYHSTNNTDTKKVFNYTVSYKHTWFDIINFKMYRISRLEVFDYDTTNVGGKLFAGGTYTVTPSSSYESRFNNSRGKVDRTLIVTFPAESYYLDPVYVTLSKPANDTSTSSGSTRDSKASALASANAKLAEVDHKKAADHENLTITYQYDNDFMELDGAQDMLQRNYKTWSEHIIKETDAYVRDLNSTKTGSGQVNGTNLNYTSNLMNYMKPTLRLTTNSDFAPNYQTVPWDRPNGLRTLTGKIHYTIVTDSKYNVGSNSFHTTDATYQLNHDFNVVSTSFTNQSKSYINTEVNKVNVLTPANFGSFELITDQKVDHSTGAGNATILQKNAWFTITPTTAGSSTAGYSLGDTREFIKGYYFIFDFNIIYNGTVIPSYQPIYLAGRNASITAKTTDSFGGGAADQLTNSIKIVAITTNITGALQEYFDNATYSNYNYMDYINNKVRNTGVQNQSGFMPRADIINDAYHAIYTRITTRNLGRIFDFAVTDCTDLAFKDIFKTTTTGNVNTSTGKSYYSGYKKWNLYSSAYNEMVNRTDVGSSPQNILPLGPYKNTNTKYVNAPKMGYRISFDLKTTGYMASNNQYNSRRVEITPRYYYISKDGKTFDKNIKLYFKNSNGSYIDFATSGYTIYYKPNDGYRYLRNSMYTDVFTLMSTKLEPLTVSTKMVLTNKSMSTNNTSFLQAWYGEFKLPNSTIAVSTIPGNPNNNVNNPYKDGYIGVIFDIQCIDSGGFTIAYNASDKSANSSMNTSQWDYEGFMNFQNPGSPASAIRYQLQKDMWLIDNTRYQDVKGTVVLFDIDNRAANDFE